MIITLDLTLPDRKILSNIWTKISFTSDEPDPTIILERREGLEKYLQVQCSYICCHLSTHLSIIH